MPLYLTIVGKVRSQIFKIKILPCVVGRADHCDIILNEPTIAPIQLIIDCDSDGKIIIASRATSNDNPTKLHKKVLVQPVTIVERAVTINAGRLVLRLSQTAEELPKTIQLNPSGWLGFFTKPTTSIVMILILLFTATYEDIINSVKPFEPQYERYFDLAIQFLALVGYGIFIHLSRVRFSLTCLSLSLFSLILIGNHILPFFAAQLEYYLNTTTEKMAFYVLYLLLAVSLWFFALQKQLHLQWKKAMTHALLVCLPIMFESAYHVVKGVVTAEKNYIEGKFNGQLEPYNWHLEKTQSLDVFFDEANKQLIKPTKNE